MNINSNMFYLIQYFIEELENSNLNEQNKKLFIKKIYQFYYSRIEFHIDQSIEYAEEYKYDVPFIVVAISVKEIMKDKRIKYGINDSGTY